MKKTMRQVAIEVKAMFPDKYVSVEHVIDKYTSGKEEDTYRIYVEEKFNVVDKSLTNVFSKVKSFKESLC